MKSLTKVANYLEIKYAEEIQWPPEEIIEKISDYYHKKYSKLLDQVKRNHETNSLTEEWNEIDSKGTSEWIKENLKIDESSAESDYFIIENGEAVKKDEYVDGPPPKDAIHGEVLESIFKDRIEDEILDQLDAFNMSMSNSTGFSMYEDDPHGPPNTPSDYGE